MSLNPSLADLLSRVIAVRRGASPRDGQIWLTPCVYFVSCVHVNARIKRIAYAQTMFTAGFVTAEKELRAGKKIGYAFHAYLLRYPVVPSPQSAWCWIWWVLPTAPYHMKNGHAPSQTNMAYKIPEDVALEYITTPSFSMQDIASFQSEVPTWNTNSILLNINPDTQINLLDNFIVILGLIE